MSKRSLIVILAGLNLMLLAVLVLSTYTPPAAFAQVAGRGSDFILVAAEAELKSDGIYLIDVRNKQLHVFRPTFPHVAGQAVRVGYLSSRDLARDFKGAAR